jgi:hypothetical protein
LLAALARDDVEILLLAPELLARGVDLELERLRGLLGLGHRLLDGLDLLLQARHLALQPRDLAVVLLQLDQRL